MPGLDPDGNVADQTKLPAVPVVPTIDATAVLSHSVSVPGSLGDRLQVTLPVGGVPVLVVKFQLPVLASGVAGCTLATA